MTALIIYWLFAAIFFTAMHVANLHDNEEMYKEHKADPWYKRGGLWLFIIVVAPVILPIGLGVDYYETSKLRDDQLKKLREKENRLFKDED